MSDKEGKLDEDATDDDVEDGGNDGQEVVGEQPVVEPAVGVDVQQQQLPSSPPACAALPSVHYTPQSGKASAPERI